MWPIEDSSTTYRQARAFAEGELSETLEAEGLLVLGEVEWEMVEHDPAQWPHTDLVLVAKVPVVPAHPTREQWPVLVRYYVDRGWTDRSIGKLLGLPKDSVTYQRKKHRIGPGVPPGYRSLDEIREPAA